MTEEPPKQPPKKPKITYTGRSKPMPPNVAASFRELAAMARAQREAEEEQKQP